MITAEEARKIASYANTIPEEVCNGIKENAKCGCKLYVYSKSLSIKQIQALKLLGYGILCNMNIDHSYDTVIYW